ncbi:uncharacterized protein PV07_02808 [Cladophialophora immunda]|uniref:Heterokaryon incompatibility domain-containing protein n=1 Tax=Cladophialophora immunda TaxID=569365 RepID=A0A0D2D620_9EURO|nr:uncharacterized protein PV07_02808 [Cladophialophora immunda]KIW31134.1 hypothetical protein PV07_02808 [Cladophialophora immunda]
MATNPQFRWQPLAHPTKSIRLIELLSAKSKDAPLELSLSTWSFDAGRPSYEAISYTRGDARDEEEILVSGERERRSQTQTLRIRKNLSHCLKRLRQPSGSRYLWVDGICIDQRNDEEKGAQVSIMGKIFSGAERVLVWLGEEGDGSSDRVVARATKRRWWAFGASFCIPISAPPLSGKQLFPDYKVSPAELVCRVCEHYPPMIKDGVEMRDTLAKILDVAEGELQQCIAARGGVRLNRPLHRRVYIAGKTAMSITKHCIPQPHPGNVV